MVLIVRKAIKSLGECLKADSQFKGPIHDHLSTIVNGLVTLRKYERIDYFRNAFVNDLEKSTNVVFCYYLINRWMGFHLDFVCLLFSTGTTFFTIYMKGKVPNEVLAFTF